MTIETLKHTLAQFHAALDQFHQTITTLDDNKTFITPDQDRWLTASINTQLFEFTQRSSQLMQWQQKFTQELDHIAIFSINALDCYSRCYTLFQEKQETLTGIVALLSDIYQQTQLNPMPTDTKQQAWCLLARFYAQLGSLCQSLNTQLMSELNTQFTPPVNTIASAALSMQNATNLMNFDPNADESDDSNDPRKRTRYK